MGSSTCTACWGKISCLRTSTAVQLKVPSKSSSECVSRTCSLPRNFWSSGTSADLAFKDSWNGAHHQLEPKWVTSPSQSVLLYQYKSTKAQGQSQKYSICLWGRFPGTANKEVQVTHTGHKLLSTAQMMFSLWRTGISPRPEFGSLLLSFSKHQLYIKNKNNLMLMCRWEPTFDWVCIFHFYQVF